MTEERPDDVAGFGRYAPTQLEGLSNRLDCFTPTPVETHIKDIVTMKYDCTGLDTRGPYQFRIDSIPNHFVDLSTLRLVGKFKVVKFDGTNLAATHTSVSICNMAPQTLFQSCDTFFNDKMISSVWTPAMHYKSYIETLFTYDKSAAKTHLQASRFAMDTAGHFDSKTPANNAGCYTTRRAWCAQSKDIDFSVPLHEDICSTNNYIPPNVEIKFRLTRNPDTVVIQQIDTTDVTAAALKDTGPLAKIELVDLKLQVKKIVVSPEFALAIGRKIQSGTMAKFPYIRSEMHSRQISKNQLLYDSHLLLVGDNLPRSIIVGMVEQDAFNGHREKSPYNFQHFDCTGGHLTLNGKVYPMSPVNLDFTNSHYMEGYRWLMDNTGIMNGTQTNMVTPDYFKGGCFFLAWDLSECLNYHKHQNLQGTIDIHLKFSRMLPKNITMLVYVTKHDTIFLDRNFAPHHTSEIAPPPHKRVKTTS